MSFFSEGMNALLAFQWGTLFSLCSMHACSIIKLQNKVKGLETTVFGLTIKLPGALH